MTPDDVARIRKAGYSDRDGIHALCDALEEAWSARNDFETEFLAADAAHTVAHERAVRALAALGRVWALCDLDPIEWALAGSDMAHVVRAAATMTEGDNQ